MDVIYFPNIKAIPGTNTQKLFAQLSSSVEQLDALSLREEMANWDHDGAFPYPESISPVSFQEEKIGNLLTSIYKAPDGDEYTPTVLLVHGGGFFCELANVHKSLMAHIAARIPCHGVLPHYSLAPEVKLPHMIEEVTSVLRALLTEPEKYGVTSNLVVVGHSSGGNLVWSAVLALLNSPATRKLIDKISQLILISPWVDISMATTKNSPYQSQQDSDKMLQAGALEQISTWALPSNADSADPLFSPIYRPLSDMKGMPKSIIIAGEIERLLGDAVKTAQVLRSAGVAAQLVILKGQSHNHSAHAGLRDGVFTPDIIAATVRGEPLANLRGSDGLGLAVY